MNVELLLGMGVLILGMIYGWWSFFDKRKKYNDSISSKVVKTQDKLLPISLIIFGIIIILKNV